MSNNIKIDIKYDATQLIDSSITPIAKSISRTVSSIFDLTLGKIADINDRYQLKREYELKAFRNQLEADINSIPEENLTEPNVATLGTALESSKYFFEEEEIRNMFSKLIASSMDSSKIQKVRPTFSYIIQQLNHIDALNLVELSKLSTAPIAQSEVIQTGTKYGEQRKFQYIFFSNRNIEPFSETMSASLDNLQRLGLITISFTQWFNDDVYKWHKNPYIISTYTKDYFDPNIEEKAAFTISKGIIYLSNLGRQFVDVCL